MSDFTLTSPVPVGGREDRDHYPTPRWCTLALIAHDRPASEAVILDPSCGEGEILDVFRGNPTIGIELDEGRAAAARARGICTYVHDALDRHWPDADRIVGNPPYRLAVDFAWKAAAWAEERPERKAALLLRLSFLEPAGERRTLFRRHPPDVLILPRRPAFDGKGTDSIASAWFCWPGEGRLVWLPP